MSEDADLHDEVRSLVAQFRAHLEHRGRSGALGVGTADMPRMGTPPAVSAPPSASPTPAPIAADASLPARETIGQAGLQLVRDELGDCRRCALSGGRKNLVFGVGNPEAHLVFVGEAPGRDEDEQGEPFVGKAGQLLTRMIEAMGYGRSDVYICNVIKCRPPENRNPEPDEVARCEPFLKKQLAVLRPRVIVALGKFAAHCLCGEETPITRLRGNWRQYQGIQVMPTYHPAYLLRNPDSKREVWNDLKAVLDVLARLGITPPHRARGA